MVTGKGFIPKKTILLLVLLTISAGCGNSGGSASNHTFALNLDFQIDSGQPENNNLKNQEDTPIILCPVLFDIKIRQGENTILEENTALALDCESSTSELIPGKKYTLYTQKNISIFSENNPRVTVEIVGVLPGDTTLGISFSSLSGSHTFEVDFNQANSLTLNLIAGNAAGIDTTFFNSACENTDLLKSFIFGNGDQPGILENLCGPVPPFGQFCDTPQQECDPFTLPGTEGNICPFLDTCYLDCQCHAALCVNFAFNFLGLSSAFQEQVLKDVFGCPDCDDAILQPELGETCEPVLNNCPVDQKCQDPLGTYECTCGPICESGLTCSDAEAQVRIIPDEFEISCTLGMDCCEALSGGFLTCEDEEGRGCCVEVGEP